MKISFLVTYYNQKEYVRQSLDSILAIDKPCDWEILVGDDGSSDGTTEVVREYMAQYPEHIFLYVMDREPGKKYEIVRRSSANRLNLVDHMTGGYFCFLDGDDCYCDTQFIRKALDIYEKQPALSVVAFGYQMFSDKSGVQSRHTLSCGIMDTAEYLRKGMYTHAGACVFRNFMSEQRKAFLHELAYYDDNDIVINNLKFGTMYAVAEVVYSYRQTESSTFNAMGFAERAVLNSQGYDVDCLILPQQREALLARNSLSLLWLYYLRGSLKRLLGAGKWQRYLDSCRKLENSLTYRIMNVAEKTAAGEKIILQALFPIMKEHPKRALKEFLKCVKYRVKR